MNTNTRLTLFTATLVQDSALSVSGVDRDSSADQPFTLVDGVPILSGRGLKGAAVALARRFFYPLPRSVSEDPPSTKQTRSSSQDPVPRSVSDDSKGQTAYRRSAWEFANAKPGVFDSSLRIRAGVGIRHKTGARAGGVLYDREVVPAGTRWPLSFRVDWSLAGPESDEAEGILGYVLARHWSAGRCWLGGGAARGLGWCHIEDLCAYRLDQDAYGQWVESGRIALPSALGDVPMVEPTRSWCFRTLDLTLSFGDYRPAADEPAWGLDMLAVGAHDTERTIQVMGDGTWAEPSWTSSDEATLDVLATDRALVMDRGRPLLPGSSIRGPLRHAFSRAKTAAGQNVRDPHPVNGDVGEQDPGGQMFGTVAKSSLVLIRDSRAEAEWVAARLHLHAEDEFSASSYGSAKRDTIRLLRGMFPVRIVVEGPDTHSVEPLIEEIDRLAALGALGHLPIGGQKTRGAGWGQWQAASWVNDDVHRVRSWTSNTVMVDENSRTSPSRSAQHEASVWPKILNDQSETTYVRVTPGQLDSAMPTLGEAALHARAALGDRALVAWWCDPTIDLTLAVAPAVFGRHWPDDKESAIRVDEAAFYTDQAVWRLARTVEGSRWVLIEEVGSTEQRALRVSIVYTPARLHGSNRFAAAQTDRGVVHLKEWHVDGQRLGFTVMQENR